MNYTRQSEPVAAGQKTESRFSEALPVTTKYRAWYNLIIDRARSRVLPTCYTEVHHVKPRALGGGDEETNLVRLTYREHFVVHWLLTKSCTGRDRRAMQYAMNAMTMPLHGQRVIAGWQFEAVKRAIKDLQDDPEVEIEWRRNYLAAKQRQAELDEQAALRNIDRREAEKQAILAEIETTPVGNLAGMATRFLKVHRRGKKWVPLSEANKQKRAERIQRLHAEVFPELFR